MQNNELELWYQYKSDTCHQAELEEAIIIRYSKLVKQCARSYYLVGGDTEDLVQEGFIGLISAISSYNPESELSLSSYAEVCIRRRMLDAIKRASQKKSFPLNSSISLESSLPSIDLTQSISPEDLLIEKEHSDEISTFLKTELSNLEKKVLDLYIKGFSYEEIAENIKKPRKSVDNAIQRIRKKLINQFS